MEFKEVREIREICVYALSSLNSLNSIISLPPNFYFLSEGNFDFRGADLFYRIRTPLGIVQEVQSKWDIF